jgi:hypothetical protein
MALRKTPFLIPVLVVVAGAFAGMVRDGATRAEPPKEEIRTILPGEGLKECHIGGSIQDARDLFGKSSSEKDGYVHFADQGVEVKVNDAKIEAMFFHYRSRSHERFEGKTDKGIGKDSSIEEVIKLYGKPDRIGESVISPFGPEPGATEHFLPYAKLGIAFTFYDKQLANVRVFSKDK